MNGFMVLWSMRVVTFPLEAGTVKEGMHRLCCDMLMFLLSCLSESNPERRVWLFSRRLMMILDDRRLRTVSLPTVTDLFPKDLG